MRFDDTFVASAGREGTPTKLTPRSAADFCSTGRALALTKYVPAGYVLPFACSGDLSQYTSPLLLNARLMTVTASFSSCDIRKPAAPWALAMVPAGGFARPSIRLVGASKPSSTRSNFTPISYASVHPALSYGRRGGPPGYAKSFG